MAPKALPQPTPEETAVRIDIVAGTAAGEAGTPVLVSAIPPAGSIRAPVDICCVVDVSGSMSAEATVQTEAGASNHGLTVLDVVKHALKTIIRNTQDSDRLALVAYSNDAKTIFGVTPMDEAGRQTTEARLADLHPDGMTNLWDGLKNGMDLLKAAAEPGRLQHIMLFTDGLPNINPPRGILPMVKRLKDKEGKLPCTVSTFGFGYELDSELLSDLAILGSGTYAFIPDAGFVGTVFVNAMTNLLVTMAKDVELTLRPLEGVSFSDGAVMGGYPCTKVGDNLVVNCGSMQFGQSKDVIVNASNWKEGSALEASLKYVTRAGGEPVEVKERGGGPADKQKMQINFCRLQVVDTLRRCMKMVKLTGAQKAGGQAMPLGDAQALIAALATQVQSANTECGNVEPLAFLLEDLQGQVSEAFSREDWYTKWGVHYLPSLMCAHLAQICNNFKDPGVQNYGGDLFSDLRDIADDIFLTLPAPTPSARPPPAPTPQASRPSAGSAPRPAPAIDMHQYYDRYGG